MKTILFPTDFSAGAENAFKYAIHLCDKLKAKLILFNSFHIPAYTGEIPLDEDVEEQLMNIAEDELLKLETKALLFSKNIDVKCIVNYGLAVDNIISVAEEKHADLVIMGTKGASGLKEVFIGSNAASVMEKASCPVLVIPEKGTFKNIDKIVFATNFQDNDFESIAFLTEIAQLFNSEILILHISEFLQTNDYEKDLQQWFSVELKKRANVKYEKISFHHIVGGNTDYELEEFIEKNDVDMLALSMRKRNIFSKLFGRSLSKKMAFHSNVPLLAFHAAKHVTDAEE